MPSSIFDSHVRGVREPFPVRIGHALALKVGVHRIAVADSADRTAETTVNIR
jgi:hypothetical protein